MSTNCMVTVTIELGHQANLLKERSPEGFTHDWNVFVRGYEGSKIENFVEKVVFKLHKTFKTPTRVISEPPYRVTECGYAGFHLPIEIHFKNKQTPRKIPFTYDLFLNVAGTPPINNIRYEKLKFQNPTPEFKAKLIRAGGIEQGSDGVPIQRQVSESLSTSTKNAVEKRPKSSSSNKEKHKKVKKVKKSPVRRASPASLPSLSPTSSEDEEEKSPPVKEWVPTSSSQSKKESSFKKESSPIEKHKTKHESSSHKLKHSSSEKDSKDIVKSHKDKEKRSSSHHRDESKKEKEHKSHKSHKDSYDKHKEREGSHSSSKSSSSSHGEKSSSHKEKSSSHSEKPSSHGEKKSSSHFSSKDKLPSKSKEKGSEESSSNSSSKKHKSSHKRREKDDKSISKHKTKESSSSPVDVVSEKPKKSKEDSSKPKTTSEKEKLSKHATKRPPASPSIENEIEKKKVKRSSSVGSEDRASTKSSSAEKDKVSFSTSDKVSFSSSDKKEAKVKESKKLSLSDTKHKHSKNRISEKSKSSSTVSSQHTEGKPKSIKDHPSVEKALNGSSKSKEKPPKLEKTDSLTKAEQLAMTADFQPQLLLSPVRSQSDEDNEAPDAVSQLKLGFTKASKNHSSNESLSSLSSSDESDKSDNEDEKQKNIVSDLVDSDSGSEEDSTPTKPVSKDMKSSYSHTPSSHGKFNKKQTSSSLERTEKYSSNLKRNDYVAKKDIKESSSNEGKKKSSLNDGSLGGNRENVSPNGLGVLAPNGIPMGELFAINEKIERAQDDDNITLINRVVDIIEESSDYDMDDTAFSFNICSLEKHLVVQIQNILRD